MHIRPLHDRVVVKFCETESVTSGGLYIPDTAKEKPVRGTVVAVSDDVDLSVKIGDEVLFGKYAGTAFKIDDEERVLLREEEILGIVER